MIVLWKHNEKDEWINADTDELIEAYESIVRCKDCEYKRLNDDGDTRYYYCALEDRPNRQWSVDDTDFCSWAKMKGAE